MDIKPYLKYYIGVAKVKLKESPWTVWTLDGNDVKYIDDNPQYLNKIDIYLNKPITTIFHTFDARSLHMKVNEGNWIFGIAAFTKGTIKELKDLEV